MSRRRARARARRAAIAAAALLCGACEDRRNAIAERPGGQRPELMLLTTLPLVFGDEFGLESGGSPTLSALETRYRVTPINVADAASLRGGRLLLMAHPLAQPAEALVELDAWVRGGGTVLLLADPMLEWPSERPLGDPLRPPPAFADAGLLAHWGLRLDAPDERGPKQQQLGGLDILTASPGALSGRCAISGDRLVARCSIGKGTATIVADADFLNVRELDGPTEHNLDALLAELGRLERSDSRGVASATDLSTGGGA